MSPRRAVATRIPLALVLAAALAGFSRSLSSATATVLAAATLATPLVAVRLDPSLERLARMLARFAVVAAILAGWVLAIAPMLHGERTDDVLRTMGLALAGCALPLAIGRPRADGTVIVCAMGLLGLAGLHRMAEIRPYVAIAGVAGALHVAVRAHVQATGSSRAALARTALSFGIAGAVASAIAIGLPPAQRSIERALLRGRVIELGGRSGLASDDVRIGAVSSLARSERPVLRVYGPRAQKLRAHVYVRFDGRVWHASTVTRPSAPTATAPAVGARASAFVARMGGVLRLLPGHGPDDVLGDEVVATRIEPIELDEALLVSPGDALAVKTEDEVLVDEHGLLVRVDRRLPDPYVVVHRRRVDVGDDRAPDEEGRAIALSLPRLVDPRVRALAAELSKGGGDARATIARTVAHVRAAARYSLDAGASSSPDVVSDFLFERRAGYCEHFASAVALLLRLQGVPARYVTGFQVDELDLEGAHYLVRDANAHAWVEAWVDGVGWIEADATPITERLALRPPRRDDALARLRARLADLRALLRYGALAEIARGSAWPIAIGLSVVGLGYVARNEVRRRRAEAKTAARRGARAPLDPEVEACVRAIDAAWARAGRPRPRSSGLTEHARAVEEGGLDVDTAAAIRDASARVHRAAFAGEHVPRTELARARERLRA